MYLFKTFKINFIIFKVSLKKYDLKTQILLHISTNFVERKKKLFTIVEAINENQNELIETIERLKKQTRKTQQTNEY